MSHHQATIHWQCDDGDFLAHRYSRAHVWRFDGGAEVRASSSPQVVPLPMSDAAAVDPEEAFVASLASCHMLWFLDIAARGGFRVRSYEDAAVGVMAKNAQGRTAITQVTLRPRVAFDAAAQPSREALDALHHEAHAKCFLAASVLTAVVIEPAYD
ncbi:MAG: OsmC family protein [Rhizobacter sp.]|nr:OsmC family protein [Burkholderiaceae bacterium]MCO5124354.1 OsmC family protein [Rhizobacter sp.]